jgi:hypothetical protein
MGRKDQQLRQLPKVRRVHGMRAEHATFHVCHPLLAAQCDSRGFNAAMTGGCRTDMLPSMMMLSSLVQV